MRPVSPSLVRLAVLVALAWAAPSVHAGGKLWIVADSGCPGVHFSTIQEAVDAASDGDVILVRPRVVVTTSYAPFDVNGKSLAIVADGRGRVGVSRDSSIRNLGALQWVVMQGFADFGTLDLRANAGSVWLEDTAFRVGPSSAATAAVSVTDSASVLLSRCQISGVGDSRIGLLLERSRAQLYDTTVTGGRGSSLGGTGGVGLEVRSGTASLGGCEVRGGAGAPGLLTPHGGCIPAGSGGDGLVLTSATDSVAYLLATAVAGGPGGGAPAGCWQGTSGAAVSGPGRLTRLLGAARSFETTSPVLENGAVALKFEGRPGDVTQLFVSGGQQQIFLPGLGGTVAPALPGVAVVTGLVPPSGKIELAATMPAGVVNAGEAVVVYAQGLFASGYAGFLGSTSAWVVLDENHDPFDGCRPMRRFGDGVPASDR